MTTPQELRALADAASDAQEAGDVSRAMELYQAVLATDHDGREHDPVVRESMVTARFGLASLRLELGELEAAERGYASVVALLDRIGDEETAHERAMALLDRGIALELLGRLDEAEHQYELAAAHRDDHDPAAREAAFRASVNRAVLLARTDRARDALRAARQLSDALSGDTAAWAREQAAMALRLVAQLETAAGRRDEAAQALDQAVAIATGSDLPELEEQAVAARRERDQLMGRTRR